MSGEWLIDAVRSFIKSDEWRITLVSFASEWAHAFDTPSLDPGEHTHEQLRIWKDYQGVVAAVLDNSLAPLGTNVEAFAKCCDDVLEQMDASSPSAAAVHDLLREFLAYGSFGDFAAMMRGRARGEASPEAVASLVAMGFDTGAAAHALRRREGDATAALELLLSEPPPQSQPRLQPQPQAQPSPARVRIAAPTGAAALLAAPSASPRSAMARRTASSDAVLSPSAMADKVLALADNLAADGAAFPAERLDAQMVDGASHALAAAGEVAKAHSIADAFLAIARREFDARFDVSLPERRIAFALALAQRAVLAVAAVARAMFLAVGAHSTVPAFQRARTAVSEAVSVTDTLASASVPEAPPVDIAAASALALACACVLHQMNGEIDGAKETSDALAESLREAGFSATEAATLSAALERRLSVLLALYPRREMATAVPDDENAQRSVVAAAQMARALWAVRTELRTATPAAGRIGGLDASRRADAAASSSLPPAATRGSGDAARAADAAAVNSAESALLFDMLRALAEGGGDGGGVDEGDCLSVLTLLADCGPGTILARDEHGNTLLMQATILKRIEFVEACLLRVGGDAPLSSALLDARDAYGVTALHIATHEGSASPLISSMLLHAGASANVQDEEGCTPLHYAACTGDVEVVANLLLLSGADANVRNAHGFRAVDFASAIVDGAGGGGSGGGGGHAQILELLAGAEDDGTEAEAVGTAAVVAHEPSKVAEVEPTKCGEAKEADAEGEEDEEEDISGLPLKEQIAAISKMINAAAISGDRSKIVQLMKRRAELQRLLAAEEAGAGAETPPPAPAASTQAIEQGEAEQARIDADRAMEAQRALNAKLAETQAELQREKESAAVALQAARDAASAASKTGEESSALRDEVERARAALAETEASLSDAEDKHASAMESNNAYFWARLKAQSMAVEKAEAAASEAQRNASALLEKERASRDFDVAAEVERVRRQAASLRTRAAVQNASLQGQLADAQRKADALQLALERERSSGAQRETRAASSVGEAQQLREQIETQAKRQAALEEEMLLIEQVRLGCDLLPLWLLHLVVVLSPRIPPLPPSIAALQERSQYYNQVEEMKGKIRVFVRLHSGAAPSSADADVARVVNRSLVRCPGRKAGTLVDFDFDCCFGTSTEQEQVFTEARRMVQSCLDGFNVCLFAYGPSGTGKTHTMFGNSSGSGAGICPRAVEEIFRITSHPRWAKRNAFKCEVDVVELYCKDLIDLLAPKSSGSGSGQRGGVAKVAVRHRDDGAVYIDSLTKVAASSADELNTVIARGLKGRHTRKGSSRSHIMVSIAFEVRPTDNGEGGAAASQVVTRGKLLLIDLAAKDAAGGEAGSSGGAADAVARSESLEIGKSLAALGNVISALTEEESGGAKQSGRKKAKAKAHVPYRAHKLTDIMSEALGGNSKAILFVTVSAAKVDAAQTFSALTWSKRLRNVQNSSVRTVETDRIQQMQREVARLKAKLVARDAQSAFKKRTK